jgi:hypothetical protein
MVTLQAASTSSRAALCQGAAGQPLTPSINRPPPGSHGARRLAGLQPQPQPLRRRGSWRARTLRTEPSSVTPGSGVRRGPDADEPPPRSTKAAAAASASAGVSASDVDVSEIIGTISTRVLASAVPEAVLQEWEHKLQADIKTVGVTLTAILGVIIFWRGVWSLLDHYIGDSVFGDVCCSVVGLAIVLYIRLSGARLASFWPPS